MCGKCDGNLPSGKCQGIEPGIKFTAYSPGAEQGPDHHHHFEHHEGFQKPDEETAHDDDVHVLRIATDETQQGLHDQIEQQHRLRCGGIANPADDGIGHRQSRRCGIVGHCHVLAQYPERVGYFHRTARIGPVHQQHWQQDDKYCHDAKPLRHPSAGG